MDLSTVEKVLNDNGVVKLGYTEYSTEEKDFIQINKFEEEYDFLCNLIVEKMEKDLNVDWVRGTNLVFSYFEPRDKEWWVWLHNIKTQEPEALKIKDVLNDTRYLDKLKREDILYLGN